MAEEEKEGQGGRGESICMYVSHLVTPTSLEGTRKSYEDTSSSFLSHVTPVLSGGQVQNLAWEVTDPACLSTCADP